jgi:hypothetical protein
MQQSGTSGALDRKISCVKIANDRSMQPIYRPAGSCCCGVEKIIIASVAAMTQTVGLIAMTGTRAALSQKSVRTTTAARCRACCLLPAAGAPDRISRLFRALSADAGLPPIRLHDLRHRTATLWCAARDSNPEPAD